MRNIIQYPIDLTDLLSAIKFAQHSHAQLNAIGGVQPLALQMLEEFVIENSDLAKQFCERQRVSAN